MKPYCVRLERETIECFANREAAETLRDELGRERHHIRVAREEAEQEMRRRVEAQP